MFYLDESHWFPPTDLAYQHGLLAIGGDLNPDRLLLAYKQGIFPWFNEDTPPLWWSPPSRMVVDLHAFKAPKSMRKIMRDKVFQCRWNERFPEVIRNCQQVPRPDQDGTWISNDMLEAYEQLHNLGWAKSLEVYNKDGSLVGGLYGIDLGHVFCGESMFSLESNASKAGFITLVEKLKQENYKLLDCQIYNEHLAKLGAFEIPRAQFLSILKN
jgi:leucyl/phenylalanyl-tRNA--protein transferase